MSSKGLVYLYDSDNNQPITVKKYFDRKGRRAIIDNWRKLYAGAFYRCYIIISPKMPEDYDYESIERELDKNVPEKKVSSIKRPKAEYKGIYNVPPLYDYGL